MNQQDYIALEDQYGAHNYHPLPVVLSRGQGAKVWDTEGKEYFDFLSAYSAVNQGHGHPKIVSAMVEQAQTLALTSRAFYNDKLGVYEKFVCEYFGFDKVLPMNTGAEAVETALKLCRKWAYEKKGLPENQAQIIVCENNFHGRTTTIISFSNDETARKNFGPYTDGFLRIPYDDLEALKAALESNPNVAGFLVEPIQGEAGVYVPSDGYLKGAKALCEQHGVLFIADEVQTGISRTGRRLAVDHEDVKPDILILGKAISGGVYPISAVLANDEIMNVIKPGQHGSTFGGNPVAAAVAVAALTVAQEEKLAERAEELGQKFRAAISEYIEGSKIAKLVRGKGLLNAVVINDHEESETAWNICLRMADKGLLAKPTHGNIIRFAPPLVISEEDLMKGVKIITDTLQEFEDEAERVSMAEVNHPDHVEQI
ncbi:ornithine--oxo-acid transaminase [Deinococcus sp. Marseille-Q6407]|uniref:ornithine--oxo-acid transaminase n=1 Tax=Deinococcus sp. Marseille-Q6407 TaxID=2969223 RepID=UPI0021BEAB66|nr:ornithine--oxo-acid transaminase [Deinococcus sp. Marseille-Q6407]